MLFSVNDFFAWVDSHNVILVQAQVGPSQPASQLLCTYHHLKAFQKRFGWKYGDDPLNQRPALLKALEAPFRLGEWLHSTHGKTYSLEMHNPSGAANLALDAAIFIVTELGDQRRLTEDKIIGVIFSVLTHFGVPNIGITWAGAIANLYLAQQGNPRDEHAIQVATWLQNPNSPLFAELISRFEQNFTLLERATASLGNEIPGLESIKSELKRNVPILEVEVAYPRRKKYLALPNPQVFQRNIAGLLNRQLGNVDVVTQLQESEEFRKSWPFHKVEDHRMRLAEKMATAVSVEERSYVGLIDEILRLGNETWKAKRDTSRQSMIAHDVHPETIKVDISDRLNGFQEHFDSNHFERLIEFIYSNVTTGEIPEDSIPVRGRIATKISPFLGDIARRWLPAPMPYNYVLFVHQILNLTEEVMTDDNFTKTNLYKYMAKVGD